MVRRFEDQGDRRRLKNYHLYPQFSKTHPSSLFELLWFSSENLVFLRLIGRTSVCQLI